MEIVQRGARVRMEVVLGLPDILITKKKDELGEQSRPPRVARAQWWTGLR